MQEILNVMKTMLIYHPSSTVVSNASCCAARPVFESRKGRDVCCEKCLCGMGTGTLNSRRAASPLMRLVDWEESLDQPQGLSQLGSNPAKSFCHMCGSQS
ncbi:hypothetical protein TNCV_4138731 [Trichonephila clavipes]|nr:hypothetical protein TNCV_4138731 [Trichonephila clavipes]